MVAAPRINVRILAFALVILPFLLSANAQENTQPKPSTPEERQRFLSIAHKLEQDPLDETLRQDRSWALNWLENVPDINVSICPPELGNLFESRYRYMREIAAQFSLDMAAFIIEHPKQVNDVNAQYLAGVEGALRAYKSILKTQPMATSSVLEALLNRQDQGKLDPWVKEQAKACQGGDQATSWHFRQ
ncbi:MAG: hypothetical protein ACRD4I_07915 [Candidatus Angelobacter sp.]